VESLPCYGEEEMRAIAVQVVALILGLDGSASRELWKPSDTASVCKPIDAALQSYIAIKKSLAIVWDQHWAEDLSLPCGKPSRTGFVAKTATLTQSLTLRPQNADLKSFLLEQLPVYSGCQVCFVQISCTFRWMQ
jgi:hypothetical protein